MGELDGVGRGERGPRVGVAVSVSLGSGDVVGGAVRVADREAGVERLTSGATVVVLGEAVGATSGLSGPDGEDASVGTDTAADVADPVGVAVEGETADGDASAASWAAGIRSASSV
ncbi:hypothetical protein ACOCJ5_16995 [Knoellia sp. CPCC 206450]|uniref:hypothetical protein n=1 Tax=Knoellia tibetensis TaxID=3404798 RepID=UPI003B42F302